MAAAESHKRINVLRTILILLALTFAFYLVYGVYRTYNPGPVSTDIVEYADMRTRFAEIYPWAPGFLPPSIPASATDIHYEAFPYSVLQGRPYIDLSFTLSEEEALIEFNRLNALDPSTDERGQFQFATVNSYDKFASVHFDPDTNTFDYHIGSD